MRCFYSTFLLLSLLIGTTTARPNILFVISDDQSHQHTSAAGPTFVNTPAFDRVAKSGILFTNAVAPSPGCSPSRAAMLTGRYPWMIEEAGTHASGFPKKFVTYPDILEAAGYHIGTTGKAWGPGNYKISGRDRNPAGPSYGKRKIPKGTVPSGISSTDYAANFADFLEARPDDETPFYFWFGGVEPHRAFEKGSGIRLGKDPAEVIVPEFLPDTPEIRSDLLDYAVEIEHFDKHLGLMLDRLEEMGELENTIVVVTSDNGMAFPRAKANCFEYGINMPLAVAWPAKIPGDRIVDDVVSLIDFYPTFLEAAGTAPDSSAPAIEGTSLMPLLTSEKDGQVDPARTFAWSSRERHSSSRWNNHTYPQRALRTDQYLYIRNFKPERWPAGAPQKMGDGNYPDDVSSPGPMHGGYHDIDACPSMDFLIENRDDSEIGPFFHLSVDKRPAEELYDIVEDPACLNNLAESSEQIAKFRQQMDAYLRTTGDPRVVAEDGGEIWETYKRYSRIRTFPKPDWAE